MPTQSEHVLAGGQGITVDDGLRYSSGLTDEEWALAKAHIPRAKRGGNKRTVDMREVMNG